MSHQRPRQKRAAGATKPDKATIKGKIFEYAWWLKKHGYAKSTVKVAARLLKHLVNEGANLLDPESVKDVLASHENGPTTTDTILFTHTVNSLKC